MTNTKPLLDLPVEILQSIAGHLDGDSALALTHTCVTTRTACDAVVVWKCLIEHFWQTNGEPGDLLAFCGQNLELLKRYAIALSRALKLGKDFTSDVYRGGQKDQAAMAALVACSRYASHLRVFGCKFCYHSSSGKQ